MPRQNVVTPSGSATPLADTVTDATTFGVTVAAGAATSASRSDHRHGSPASPITRQRCTTNTAQSSNSTYANPTGFTGFAVAAGKTYRFRAVLLYTTAAATTGPRPSLTGPTMTDFMLMGSNQLTATTIEFMDVSALSTDLAFTAGIVSPAVNKMLLEGTFTPSAAGTVNLQFRSEVNGSAITVQAGSWQTLDLCA